MGLAGHRLPLAKGIGFIRLDLKLEAQEERLTVAEVYPKGNSQLCSKCGLRGKRNQRPYGGNWTVAARPLILQGHLRHLGRRPYLPVWQAMRRFTEHRTSETPDEFWFLEHEPVYTTGLRQAHHLFREQPSEIPVIETDRGGLITYHGPGQLIFYPLLDLRRLKIGVRELVSALEGCVVDLLRQYAIRAEARRDAPGVYVEGKKIASVGLKIKNGCSYHGLALNVHMDLTPFKAIIPCGLERMEMTQLFDLGVETSPHEVAPALLAAFCDRLDLRIELLSERGLP